VPRCVDRVSGIADAKQDACVTASLLIDGAHIYRLEQPGELDLSPMRAAPHLSYHQRITP
jgi:hypothetical protein